MNTAKNTISKTSSILVLGLFLVAFFFTIDITPNSLAESQTTETQGATTPETTVAPLNTDVSIEKTIMSLNIPKDNTLPWAYVNGIIENHAKDYPVIIQFFNEESGEDPMHIAQVEVGDDGSYEYKFRVRDVNLETGQVTNIFEGDYEIKIFKVVNSQDNESESI